MKKKIRISCSVQQMAQERINTLVAPDTLSRIKQSDPNPQINVYVIGHEGEAQPRRVGYGRIVLQYFRDAILQLGNKVSYGLKAFLGHNSDSSHEGREPIGEVVGKALENISGKLHSLAAVYIYPRWRDMKLDTASIEAEVEFEAEVKPGSKSKVLNIREITGLALGDRRTSEPAFAGATLLGQIQSFFKTQHKKGEDTAMDLEEIKAAIKEGKYKLSDVFSKEEIQESEVFLALKKEAHEHARRVEKKLGEERDKIEKLTEENEKMTGQLKELQTVASRSKASDLFNAAKTDRKLTEQQQKFIEKNLSSFSSQEKEDVKVKDDFNRFVDAQLKSFKEFADIYGVKVDDQNNKDSNQNKGGSGSGDNKDGSSDDSQGEKYQDPKQNDFIPQPLPAAGAA